MKFSLSHVENVAYISAHICIQIIVYNKGKLASPKDHYTVNLFYVLHIQWAI